MATSEWLSLLSVALMAFVDASVFPISVQPLLVGVALVYPRWAWGLAAIYIISSVLGSCIGYGLGRYGLVASLVRRFPQEKWEQAEKAVRRYGPFVVATGGMTPIPFPLFTIAAGVFRVSLPSLLLAVTVGRGAKAALFVLLSAHLGQTTLERFVSKHKEFLLGATFLLAMVGTWWGLRSLKNMRLRNS
ncbi:MAG: YqaA family protein [Candidatus Fervidibacter sp.]|uniref:YqaA family protein n=1 Tax=Candidatus Fervidibacter sp. TaxID=3100871 RepID=UPI0040490111